MSVLNGYRLERNGTLDFDLKNGACTVLNETIVVLCFNYYEQDVCRQSNNLLGKFTKLPNSNYEHRLTKISSVEGKKTIKRTIKTVRFR